MFWSEIGTALGKDFTTPTCIDRLPTQYLEKLYEKYDLSKLSYCCFTINPDPGLKVKFDKLYYRDLNTKEQRSLLVSRIEKFYCQFDDQLKIKTIINFFELTKQGNLHAHSMILYDTPAKHQLTHQFYVAKQTEKYFHRYLGRSGIKNTVCCTVSKVSPVYDDLEGYIKWIEYMTKDNKMIPPSIMTLKTTGIINQLRKGVLDEVNHRSTDYNEFEEIMKEIDYENLTLLWL